MTDGLSDRERELVPVLPSWDDFIWQWGLAGHFERVRLEHPDYDWIEKSQYELIRKHTSKPTE